MKMKCEVIQDLLPLYCDHQASQESCKLIEEHLEECESCRKLYEAIAEPEVLTTDFIKKNLSELEPLRKLKNETRLKIIFAVFITVIVIGQVRFCLPVL